MSVIASIPFKQARYFREMPEGRQVDLIVIHTAEVAPKPGMAKWLMDYCAKNDRVASWHFAVDDIRVTQSVKRKDIAYHAPGANSRGIGIELATRASASPSQWRDEYHQNMLESLAELISFISAVYKIPLVFVDSDRLFLGDRGVTTHAEVSKAWRKSDHTDPGAGFPMAAVLSRATGF